MEKKLESNRAMMEYVGAFVGLLVVIIIAVSVVISRFSDGVEIWKQNSDSADEHNLECHPDYLDDLYGPADNPADDSGGCTALGSGQVVEQKNVKQRQVIQS